MCGRAVTKLMSVTSACLISPSQADQRLNGCRACVSNHGGSLCNIAPFMFQAEAAETKRLHELASASTPSPTSPCYVSIPMRNVAGLRPRKTVLTLIWIDRYSHTFAAAFRLYVVAAIGPSQTNVLDPKFLRHDQGRLGDFRPRSSREPSRVLKGHGG